jgi:hypothetical protein
MRREKAGRGGLVSHYSNYMTRVKLVGAMDQVHGGVGRVVLCTGSSLWLIPF